MPNTKNAPLQVFIPNILLPKPYFDCLQPRQKEVTFNALPKGFKWVVARSQKAEYTSANHLDRVEAWLYHHLDAQYEIKFEAYPPWAMLSQSDDQAKAWTRWWASLGTLKLERDGVRFTPPEALQISATDLTAFWAIAEPVLSSNGWTALNGKLDACHVLLHNEAPLPFEQASPWSVQGIRLTDYLPMTDDCANWRRMWLKLQVELHDAPFNLARQAQGLEPLNALWFWGGGQPWPVEKQMPVVYSVSRDGAYKALEMTGHASEVVNRFVFWHNLIAPLCSPDPESPAARLSCGTQSAVYCVEFEGWGASTDAFEQLDTEVVQPMSMAGLSFEWVLLGSEGWKTLKFNCLDRLKFWKNRTDWSVLSEPIQNHGPSEQELQAAYQAGEREQAQILMNHESTDGEEK